MTVPGHMTWDALMKIGLVYSFVGLVKKIDAILRKVILFNLLYTGTLGIFKAIVFGIAFVFKSIYRTFNLVVQLIPIKGTYYKLMKMRRPDTADEYECVHIQLVNSN